MASVTFVQKINLMIIFWYNLSNYIMKLADGQVLPPEKATWNPEPGGVY
jgi:hypothetical protein